MKKKLAFQKFDAQLNTDCCDSLNNAELTLTLRMGFRQINPTGGTAEGTYHDYGNAAKPTRRIIKWTPDAWSRWKQNFVSSAQAFWTGKFWLITDSGSFTFIKGGTTYYPNVWCRFELIGNEATVAGNHHTIEVVRLHPSEKWFGSHSTLYDSKDTDSVQKATTSTGKKVMQRAHVHEVGHLLGLNHVDVGKPHCPATGDTNATACYGVGHADDDVTSVMGAGMQRRIENAYPWRESLRYFALEEFIANISNPVSLVLDSASLYHPVISIAAVWPAKMHRYYPRTEAEFTAGKDIDTRPRRPH
jgi:hypothetical protein